MQKEFLKAVQEYQNIIYKVCSTYRDNKEDREDLFQEIVYQLWKSYPSFKRESKISSWIYRIALNTAMAVYRKPKPPVIRYEEFPQNIPAVTGVQMSHNEEQMFAALQILNSVEKAVVSLFLEDFTYQEIADITGLTESNVGVKLNRIKHKLKQILL